MKYYLLSYEDKIALQFFFSTFVKQLNVLNKMLPKNKQEDFSTLKELEHMLDKLQEVRCISSNDNYEVWQDVENE